MYSDHMRRNCHHWLEDRNASKTKELRHKKEAQRYERRASYIPKEGSCEN